MDIRQLRYFMAIAEEGGITRAARVLNIEQPPLSRQLRQMEQELGVTLFDRSGSRLKLTPAGERLRQRAQGLLAQFHETVQEVKELEEGVRGVLSIGSVVSCISLLPPKIEVFRERYPEVTFKIQEGDHYQLGEQLEKRSIDLILARLPFEASGSAEHAVLPLPSDPFVAVIPAPWSGRFSPGRIRMNELADVPFLSLKTEKTTGMHEKVMKECREHGFEPRVIGECSSVAIIIALVAAGIGATVFPASVMASFTLPQIKTLPIADTEVQSGVGILWLTDRYLPKTARRFIQMFAT
ncbi:LysR family transcriptional regulator [Paenibacillus mucilaginosus]|uniref:LysR family transcriptional regulator n=3 Tax=Paenibacillus mucilaginosus TaxID=61624 RepID=H6NHN2_9BACL|nr:LysR family transcriptional regulator [Paenibacillus mucilaginosus]AEI41056.1 transcriptional regulator, LysR family protein [Paenibacillus mucilaginosus KNP414]AFC29629.1 LysR family transcriptional regulator [Paenibacillus mucilaginosus 3016]AFH61805.1 LysR family transcriptional regulator [Paenibacillus mucilaginosus K02]MCG7211501.1 LysR family transcriptional regulator [Paenibacillus mucilaginosus]WDM30124.1 LysR family transcriptional regulator [Paenibacillus mucilaginosus]